MKAIILMSLFSGAGWCYAATSTVYLLLQQAVFAQHDGIYYVSQDVDLKQGQKAHDYFKLSDKARRQRGIPRIDKHQYSKENGLMVEALATLYSVTGEPQYLHDAQRTFVWLVQ